MIGAINFTVLNAAYICVLGDFCGYEKEWERDNFLNNKPIPTW